MIGTGARPYKIYMALGAARPGPQRVHCHEQSVLNAMCCESGSVDRHQELEPRSDTATTTQEYKGLGKRAVIKRQKMICILVMKGARLRGPEYNKLQVSMASALA